MFRDLRGNGDVIKALVGMVDSDKIPHALMLHEEDGGGGVPMALSFLQYLYCSAVKDGDACGGCPECNRMTKLIHPDVHFLYPVNAPLTSEDYLPKWRSLVQANPLFTENELCESLGVEGKSTLIAVSEAKSLIEKLSLSAVEGGYRSVLIYLPEKMNQETSNRLLKLIEEPPEKTLFILITHSPEKVLTTIASRCQRIRVRPASMERVQTGEAFEVSARLFSQLLESLLNGDLLSSLEVGEALGALPSREAAKIFCVYASGRLRDIFLCQQRLDTLQRPDEAVEKVAPRLRRDFPRLASAAVDRARMRIERNVNMKILFTDLVNTLYKLSYERR